MKTAGYGQRKRRRSLQWQRQAIKFLSPYSVLNNRFALRLICWLAAACLGMVEPVTAAMNLGMPLPDPLPSSVAVTTYTDTADVNGTVLYYQAFQSPRSTQTVAAHFVAHWGAPARVERLGAVLRYLWVSDAGTALLQMETSALTTGLTGWWSLRPWPVVGQSRQQGKNEADVVSWAPPDSQWLLRFKSQQGNATERILAFQNSLDINHKRIYLEQRCKAQGLVQVHYEPTAKTLYCAGSGQTLSASIDKAVVLRWQSQP